MLCVLVPSRTKPHPLIAQCLQRLTIPYKVMTVRGLPVVDARNALTRMVLDVAADDDIALWLDDDVYFGPHVAEALTKGATGDNVVMPNVPLRRPNAPPAAFLNDNHTPIPQDATGLVEVHLLGFLLTAMGVGLLRRLGADPFTVAPDRVTEDFSCCDRLRRLGAKLFVNMEAKAGHTDGRNDHIYFSYKPPTQLVNGQLIESDQPALPFEVRDYGLPLEREEELIRYLESQKSTSMYARWMLGQQH